MLGTIQLEPILNSVKKLKRISVYVNNQNLTWPDLWGS